MKKPLLALVFTLACALPARAGQGISAERLGRVGSFVGQAIAGQQYLGAVVLVMHQGSVVEHAAFGHRDLGRTEPLQRDAIFRIYSMSKTITAAAILVLMEEGKLLLDDPVAKYIPAFANPRIFIGGTVQAPRTRAAKSPVTIRQLLTHTAGFAAYGDRALPVNRIFDAAGLPRAQDLQTFAQRLSKLPLAHEPGAQFHYDGTASVLAGRIVEVVSGQAFDAFLKQRLFVPLRMNDTGFTVPQAQRHRIAAMTTTGADGSLAAPAPGMIAPDGEQQDPYPSGAGGLYSTAADYARFAQMLLNGGSLDGAQILGRKSVELMMSNHLTHLNPPVHEFSPAEGFGLGGYVVLDVARRGRLGSAGQFGWSGAASTYYTIDPKEQLVALLLMQHLPQGLRRDPPKLGATFYNLVYQSLID